MKKGQLVELDILDLAFGGKGLAKVDGAVVFVKDAIPGQKVRARITRKKKRFFEARALEVLRESPNFVEPHCEHAADCGGCTFQNLAYAQQVAEKETQAQALFEHLSGLQPEHKDPILACEQQFAYRNKMEFSFSNRRWLISGVEDDLPKDFALGLHVPGRFDKILNINSCQLQKDSSNAILQWLKERIFASELPPYDPVEHTGFWRNIILRQGFRTGQIMVNFVTTGDHIFLHDLAKELVAEFPQVSAVLNNQTTAVSGVSYGEYEEVLEGEAKIIEEIGGLRFEISANSFFQTNTEQAEKLYALALKKAALQGDETVYDLYCGTGTISLYFAKMAKQVFGIELVAAAIEDAKRNAELNNIDNVEFIQGDLNYILHKPEAKKLPKPDVLVLDPPRPGLHPNTVDDVLTLRPKRIVYISCNPATQARDIKFFVDGGYRLRSISPVDMFPHTPHVENVAVLEL